MINIEEYIETQVKRNKLCTIGVLNNRRIFLGTRQNKQELIVLLTSHSLVGEIWGNVFYQDNIWFACLVSIQGYFKGKDESELIEDYWRNIKITGDWSCLNTNYEENESHVKRCNDFDEAIFALGRMIENLQESHCNPYNDGTFELFKIYGCASLFRTSNNE